MDVRMSAAELALFKSFLGCSQRYLEFGAGGSTCLAASMGKAIISIDSSDEWLANVRAQCALLPGSSQPKLIKVDIGPTGDWGAPIDPMTRDKWPSYYNSVWNEPDSTECDLYLIDGRFRVACFMSTVLSCKPSTIVLVHDFSSRPHYHVIKEVSREVARCEDLSAFQISGDFDRERALSILDTYAYQLH